VAGFLPTVGRPAYVGAKHAVTGVFRALGAELAPEGIAVTVVHPAFLATPVTDVGAAAPRSTTGAPIDADDVARAVVAAMARRRRTGHAPARVLVGRTAYLADVLTRALPDTTVRLAARSLRRRP
jgi:short-subunit dehydrogenase